MPTVGQPVPGYYYDQFTDTLRPIVGGPGPKGDPGNANVTVSPNAPATTGKAGDLWVQTTTTPWTAPASMPWGIIAWNQQSNATSVGIGTVPIEVHRLNTVPLKAGRLYLATCVGRAMSQGSGSPATVRVMTPGNGAIIANTTYSVDAYSFVGIGASYGFINYSKMFTVTADGSYTLTLQAQAFVANSGYYPDSYRIEDIGPNRGQQ